MKRQRCCPNKRTHTMHMRVCDCVCVSAQTELIKSNKSFSSFYLSLCCNHRHLIFNAHIRQKRKKRNEKKTTINRRQRKRCDRVKQMSTLYAHTSQCRRRRRLDYNNNYVKDLHTFNATIMRLFIIVNPFIIIIYGE